MEEFVFESIGPEEGGGSEYCAAECCEFCHVTATSPPVYEWCCSLLLCLYLALL